MTEPNEIEPGVHFVRPGDTLNGIAARYNTTVAEIAHLNNLSHPGDLHPDGWLVLPISAAHSALKAALHLASTRLTTDLRPTLTVPDSAELRAALSGMDLAEQRLLREAALILAHATRDAMDARRIEYSNRIALPWPDKVTLIRHLGVGKEVTETGLTPDEARESAGRMLVDNGVATMADAMTWAAGLMFGYETHHPSGYAVTVRDERP